MILGTTAYRIECPYCKKQVMVCYGFIGQHKEPDSSAVCTKSGTYIGPKKENIKE